MSRRKADSLLLPPVASTPGRNMAAALKLFFFFFFELAQPLAPCSPSCVLGSACSGEGGVE